VNSLGNSQDGFADGPIPMLLFYGPLKIAGNAARYRYPRVGLLADLTSLRSSRSGPCYYMKLAWRRNRERAACSDRRLRG